MSKKDLALNNLQGLIWQNKNKKQPKPHFIHIYLILLYIYIYIYIYMCVCVCVCVCVQTFLLVFFIYLFIIFFRVWVFNNRFSDANSISSLQEEGSWNFWSHLIPTNLPVDLSIYLFDDLKIFKALIIKTRKLTINKNMFAYDHNAIKTFYKYQKHTFQTK